MSLRKRGRGARAKSARGEEWDELQDDAARARRRTRPSEEIEALRHSFDDPALAGVDPAGAAMVINVTSARCRVFLGGQELDCIVPPEIAARQKSALAVGDRVLLDDTATRLVAILPRHSVLSRPDPLNPHLQRLIAANIDVVANVVSMKSPPLRPRLIDRFLIAIQRGGAAPMIVVNKVDLDRDLTPLRVYEELGVDVVACSTKTGEGLDALRAALSGKTSALVGHSGVGKSSILNALDERLQIATGDLHRRGTGRHTTTSSTLHDLGGGTLIIDTPGIREFGLWDLTPRTLRESFPEFEEAAELCRFNDCTHLHEPACEVKERVESGALSRARYDTYVRLAEDLQCEKR